MRRQRTGRVRDRAGRAIGVRGDLEGRGFGVVVQRFSRHCTGAAAEYGGRGEREERSWEVHDKHFRPARLALPGDSLTRSSSIPKEFVGALEVPVDRERPIALAERDG